MRFLSLILGISMCMAVSSASAQDRMTPELLWRLGRVSPDLLTSQGKVVYSVTHFDVIENESHTQQYVMQVNGGNRKQLTTSKKSRTVFQELPNGKIGYTQEGQLWEMNPDGSEKKQKTNEKKKMNNIRISPKGDYILFSREVKLKSVYGKDFYPALAKSNVQIYTDLMYRHWDQWADGKFSHVFYATYNKETGKVGAPVDIMKGEPYHCPQKPFGGAEDFIWSPEGDKILYVSKKKFGTENAVSTNSDIYAYELSSGKTKNLTEGMEGYDTQPAFSSNGKRMAWTSMKRDGYESDKNDIIVSNVHGSHHLNLTAAWDGTVGGFHWSKDGESIYFTAPVEGTVQLFQVDVPRNLLVKKRPIVKQLTKGQFNITGILGQYEDKLVVGRQDMNHATELYSFDITDPSLSALTFVNKPIYDRIKMGKVEKKWVETTDGKKELVWVIYPPDFDPNKKYPTLLYCQGGPQAPVSQFYSFRWNFQLMAAHDYIIVAPNRRGLPGFGTQWNEEISKDWGGQPMQDYLSAIDSIAKLPFVDENRLGCVGASYGGYSVYQLAGMHENRFKTFIAHDGLFDLKSWYGTTEELFFANWDIGGPYWDKNNQAAQKSYREFSPSDYVNQWDTPILIIQGGKDFRVPVGQGLQAFQAAQLKGIKSKLLYFPEANHWILQPQNALVWQKEFYKWLSETL